MELKFCYVIFLIYFLSTAHTKSVKSYTDTKCKKELLNLINAACCGYWDTLDLEQNRDHPMGIPEKTGSQKESMDELCYCAVCNSPNTKYNANSRSLSKAKFFKLNSKQNKVAVHDQPEDISNEHSRQKRGYNLQYVNVQYIPSDFGKYGGHRRRDLYRVPYYGRRIYGRYF